MMLMQEDLGFSSVRIVIGYGRKYTSVFLVKYSVQRYVEMIMED